MNMSAERKKENSLDAYFFFLVCKVCIPASGNSIPYLYRDMDVYKCRRSVSLPAHRQTNITIQLAAPVTLRYYPQIRSAVG